jgi:hypothetical protein
MIALMLLALFSYDEVLHADLIVHSKIRWSKVDAGERVTVEIAGGEAKRVNPNWSPDPQPLAYDIAKERELSRSLKAARLPAPAAHPSTEPEDRTLEVIVEDAKGWHSAGTWSLSVRAWQKGRLGSVFDALEPLLSAQPELYGTGKGGHP